MKKNRHGIALGECERKSGREASPVGGRQIKKPGMTNRDQKERGQSQGKVTKRMSVANEKETQVSLRH